MLLGRQPLARAPRGLLPTLGPRCAGTTSLTFARTTRRQATVGLEVSTHDMTGGLERSLAVWRTECKV